MKKIIRFTASWCQPCKQMSRTLESINSNLPIDVVDIDEQSNTAIEYGIRSVPTLVMVEDGNVVKKMVGLKSAEEIKVWLND